VATNGNATPCTSAGSCSIFESFDGDTVAVPRYWSFNVPPCGSIQVADGALVCTAPNGCSSSQDLFLAAPDVRIQGDFDITASFTLPAFPVPSSGHLVAQLGIQRMNGTSFAVIERYNGPMLPCRPSTSNYKAWFQAPDDCDLGVRWRATTDDHGAFRVTRAGSLVSTFYWNNGWVEMNSALLSAEDVSCVLAAGSSAPGPASEVRFDSLCISGLQVTAVAPVDFPGYGLSLANPHPNPFGVATVLSYAMARTAPVRARVVDIQGRTVKKLVDGVVEAGQHVVSWDGAEDGGSRARPGIYFIELRVGDAVLSRKAILRR
jgi:hypothetical protein